MKNCVLSAESMPELHTAGNMFAKWVEVLESWGILKLKGEAHQLPLVHHQFSGWERVYGFITDNGSNMRAAIYLLPEEGKKRSTPCVAHTLQLVIEDALESQRSVHDMVAVCHNLVRYIKKIWTCCRVPC